jgi:hypothetical protein
MIHAYPLDSDLLAEIDDQRREIERLRDLLDWTVDELDQKNPGISRIRLVIASNISGPGLGYRKPTIDDE